MQTVIVAMLRYIQVLAHGAHQAWLITVRLVTGAQNATQSLHSDTGTSPATRLDPQTCKRSQAQTQSFSSASNMNILLHCTIVHNPARVALEGISGLDSK